jgi:hypothetical protein
MYRLSLEDQAKRWAARGQRRREKQGKAKELNKEWASFIESTYGRCSDAFYMYNPFEFEEDSVSYEYDIYDNGTGNHSRSYWDVPKKVVFCNFDVYGNSDEGSGRMPSWYPSEYIKERHKSYQWLWDSSEEMHKVAFFIEVLFRRLNGIGFVDHWPLYEDRNEVEKLISNMQQIAYLNLYPIIHLDENNKPVMQEWEKVRNKVWEFYNYRQSRSLMRDTLDFLEPDIFIIAGEDGVDLINRIYQFNDDISADKQSERFEKEFELNQWSLKWFTGTSKTLFVSIPHPCTTMSYPDLFKMAENIFKKYNMELKEE